MYSAHNIYVIVDRFPHSEISGSKVACHLPEAYRRLLRPSSPLTAKASTVCAYSLDHTVQANKILMRLLFFIVVLSISPDRCVKIHIGLEKIQYSIVIFLKSSDKKSVINTSAYRWFLINLGGAKRDRTADLLRARQALSQLSYSPISRLVGLGGFEPPTSPLSGVRSNQLSYRPNLTALSLDSSVAVIHSTADQKQSSNLCEHSLRIFFFV